MYLFMSMRRPWRIALVGAGMVVVLAAVAGWLATTEAGARVLLAALEAQSSPPQPERVQARAQAIVVLTGQPSRIHTAARLSLATGVPLALVGKGGGERGFAVESEEMEDTLLRRYGIGPRWVETESLDTQENAAFAWCLLSSFGVRRIALVTHSFHMPRARRRFEAEGFDVIAVPVPDSTVMRKTTPLTGASFLPSRAGIRAARGPVREWVGFLFGGVERMLDPPRPCPYVGISRPAPPS
jgi:uncharacterized SAM-binding protein YcdF (DUF218 family)